MKLFSIIIPVYYNELNLPETIPELLELQNSLQDYNFELIFVDDGSGDRSLSILREFQNKHPEIIKIVKLTRNFGSMAAIQAGLSIVKGDCVGIISADLQDPPELFIEMIQHWENDIKVVCAVRNEREESRLIRFFSTQYYALIRKFAIHNYPKGGFDFILADRQVIVEINKINEKNTNIMALIYWLGYEPVLLPYKRKAREKGTSRWTLSKKIKLFIDTFVAFSYFPIRLLSVIGFLVAGGAFIYGVIIFLFWLFVGIEVLGYVPIMIVLTITSGIQMTMLGILGEYLWRTLDEARERPTFVIDAVFDQSKRGGKDL
jgi:polyisoprenyl-phosphate glycosyltransferase